MKKFSKLSQEKKKQVISLLSTMAFTAIETVKTIAEIFAEEA